MFLDNGDIIIIQEGPSDRNTLSYRLDKAVKRIFYLEHEKETESMEKKERH